MFQDARAREFCNIVNTKRLDSYEKLKQLYYRYKGFYMTGTADFEQQVVVQFMEENCIEIKEKLHESQKQQYSERRSHVIPHNTSTKHQPTIHPPNKRKIMHTNDSLEPNNTKRYSIKRKLLTFGDNWDIDFDDITSYQRNSRHPSIQCEENYICNTGVSKLPMIFQSHLYFRNKKYYMNLFSDPFCSVSIIEYFYYCFFDVLYKHTTVSPNPWNFTLYFIKSNPCAVIELTFRYVSESNDHTCSDVSINSELSTILTDMHTNERYITVFMTGYECDAGWDDDNSVGGEHAVACGIIKQNNNVFVFILDPNGAQGEEPEWWQKYTEIIESKTKKQKLSNFKRVAHFFNKQILDVFIQEIDKKYPGTYNCTYDREINLNPHHLNFSGGKFQEDGYCLLISFFFIHILYNNIAIHNRELFHEVDDYRIIVNYINDLMIFIVELVNTEPFEPREFFYNYSINIFRFMLSFNGIEDCYQTYSLVKTMTDMNNRFQNNAYLQSQFSPITSANVMSIYMSLVFDGKDCLPSMIGVPKPNIPNYKELLSNKDYSCIRFYTPFRNVKMISKQPLRSWFDDDKERVEFFDDESICIIDNERYRQMNNDYTDCIKIKDPSVVLINLKKVVKIYHNSQNYNRLVKDYSIMSPILLTTEPSTCTNIRDPFTNKSNCIVS